MCRVEVVKYNGVQHDVRARLDAFDPDLVLIFGDDQYENFIEDVVPPFCRNKAKECLNKGG